MSAPDVAVLRATYASLVEYYDSTEMSRQNWQRQEIDAISQLASADPVLCEREELIRIKDEMQGETVMGFDTHTILSDQSHEETIN